MKESVYGVQFSLGNNYNGRTQDGQIRISHGFGGLPMTPSCAEALVKKLKSRYATVEVFEMLDSSDMDRLIATCLADLPNEVTSIQIVLGMVHDCVLSGIDPQEILTQVNHFLGDDLQPRISLQVPDSRSQECELVGNNGQPI